MAMAVDTPLWLPRDFRRDWYDYLLGTGEPGSADVPIYAAPARASAEDLSGLPPAFVTAYQIDPIRDQAVGYARMLMQAGVPTELHHYAGAFHIAHVVPGTSIGVRMMDDRVRAIRRMLPR